MKKLISVVTVIAVIMSFTTTQVKAQSPYERNRDYNNDSRQQSFDYYPSSNVYYDGSCNRYIYNNGRSWLTVNFLPFGFSIGNSPHYQVYCNNGSEIWRDNDMHRNKYCRQQDNDYRYDDRRDWNRDRNRNRDRYWHRERRYERRYNY